MVFREVTVKGIDASDYQTIQVWRDRSLSQETGKSDVQDAVHILLCQKPQS